MARQSCGITDSPFPEVSELQDSVAAVAILRETIQWLVKEIAMVRTRVFTNP